MAQDNADILARIRERKQMGEDNIQSEKDAIEADIALIRGRKKKGNDGLMYLSSPDKNGVCKWIKVWN